MCLMIIRRYLVHLLTLLLLKRCKGDASENVTLSPRIVGGNVVDIRHRPFQVSIQLYRQHFCGGALISPDTVLSAAHCFGTSYPIISNNYNIRIGANRTNAGIVVQIQSVLVHPNYNTETLDSDISLIKLQTNVTLSDTVRPIKLSERANYSIGSLASVSGWGYQQENGSISDLLRKVEVPITSQARCQKYYNGIINITNNMICAGFAQGGKDACQGDSGGPLIMRDQLIGVVSFGMGCARRSYPGVYTNIAAFADWVKNNSNYSNNGTFFSSGWRIGSDNLMILLIIVIFSLLYS